MTRRHVAMVSVLMAAVLLWFGAASAYQEAPMLEEMVAQGDLPPVAERLPAEPYVVEPRDSIGEYGGTIEVATMWINAHGDDHMLMSAFNQLIKPDPLTFELHPFFAREVEVSEDTSSYTIHFREGVKWSDGEPFTTEDIAFWYDSILLNEDLTPTPGPIWRHGDETFELEIIDDYTAAFHYAGPKPYFLIEMSTEGSIYHPKHYLTQFHPDYRDEEELRQLVLDEGYSTWYELFSAKNERLGATPLVEDLPTVASFVLTEMSSERRVYERNPYYWQVDTAGNQLPYVDRINTTLVGDTEVWNGLIISGQLHFTGRGTDVRNIPLYHEYGEEGGYRVKLWENARGAHVILQVNLSHPDEALREIFGDKRFRQALSLAIDREDINEALYFGYGEPRQYTVLETSDLFKQEYADAFIAYDPERAQALLEEMGLEMGRDGYWLRPDGERLSFTIETIDIEGITIPTTELAVEYWQAIGLDAEMRSISWELQGTRAPGNLMDGSTWVGNEASEMGFPRRPSFLVASPDVGASWNAGWVQWYNSRGEEGIEPPELVQEIRELWETLMMEPDAEARRAMEKELLEHQAENLWVIGVIGKAPYPLVVSDDLVNFLEFGYWGNDVRWSTLSEPEQLWLRQ